MCQIAPDFWFAQYASEEEATAARAGAHGHSLHGQAIRVDFAFEELSTGE